MARVFAWIDSLRRAITNAQVNHPFYFYTLLTLGIWGSLILLGVVVGPLINLPNFTNGQRPRIVGVVCWSLGIAMAIVSWILADYFFRLILSVRDRMHTSHNYISNYSSEQKISLWIALAFVSYPFVVLAYIIAFDSWHHADSTAVLVPILVAGCPSSFVIGGIEVVLLLALEVVLQYLGSVCKCTRSQPVQDLMTPSVSPNISQGQARHEDIFPGLV